MTAARYTLRPVRRLCVICSRELRVPMRCTPLACAHPDEGIEYDRDMTAEIRRMMWSWGDPDGELWREWGPRGSVYYARWTTPGHEYGGSGWYERTLADLRRRMW